MQHFPEFNRSIHVLILLKYLKVGLDFGPVITDTESHRCTLIAVAPDDQLIVYRELYCSKVTATDLADMILNAEQEDGTIRYGVLDSSLWHKRGDTGPSLAEQMNMKGCRWRPSDRS